MTKEKAHRQGRNTVEQRQRVPENKDDLPRDDGDGKQTQSLRKSWRQNQEDSRHNKPRLA